MDAWLNESDDGPQIVVSFDLLDAVETIQALDQAAETHMTPRLLRHLLAKKAAEVRQRGGGGE